MARSPRERRQTWIALGLAATIIGLALTLFRPGTQGTDGRDPDASESAVERASSERHEIGETPTLEDLIPLEQQSLAVSAERGGSMSLGGGLVEIEVPAGAVGADVEITALHAMVDHPNGLGSPAVDLQPEDVAFRQPVKLSLPVPLGFSADEVEIAVYDAASQTWNREDEQTVSEDGSRLVAYLDHFSLRRVQIRPGMNFPPDPVRGRGTFYLEADAGNSYERLIDGRWEAVERRSPEYRELMQIDRLGRHALILSGRLRAVTGARPRPEVFSDLRRTVAMPSGSAEASTGWVEVTLLDAAGEPTDTRVIARVNDFGPGSVARNAGVVVDMSRATMEALGLTWGTDFGLSSENPNLAWIRYVPHGGDRRLNHVPVKVEAYEAQPERVRAPRNW